MKKIGCAIMLGLMLVLVGWGFLFFRGASDDAAQAEEIIDAYYEAMGQGDIERALSLYSPAALSATSREETVRLLNTIESKLGAPASRERISWRASSGVGVGTESGTEYTFVYRVKYASGESTETFTLFKPMGSSLIQIMSFNITSNTLVVQ